MQQETALRCSREQRYRVCFPDRHAHTCARHLVAFSGCEDGIRRVRLHPVHAENEIALADFSAPVGRPDVRGHHIHFAVRYGLAMMENSGHMETDEKHNAQERAVPSKHELADLYRAVWPRFFEHDPNLSGAYAQACKQSAAVGGSVVGIVGPL